MPIWSPLSEPERDVAGFRKSGFGYKRTFADSDHYQQGQCGGEVNGGDNHQSFQPDRMDCEQIAGSGAVAEPDGKLYTQKPGGVDRNDLAHL